MTDMESMDFSRSTASLLHFSALLDIVQEEQISSILCQHVQIAEARVPYLFPAANTGFHINSFHTPGFHNNSCVRLRTAGGTTKQV